MDEVAKALLVRRVADTLAAEFGRQIKVLQEANDDIQGQLRAALDRLDKLANKGGSDG